MCALLRVVGVTSTPQQHDPARVGMRQNPRCCLCHLPIGRSACRGKWPAVRHHPRCPTAAVKQETAISGTPASKQSRKRRAASDPGESPEPAATQAINRRVVAPEPAPTSKKQYKTRREEQIMRDAVQ